MLVLFREIAFNVARETALVGRYSHSLTHEKLLPTTSKVIVISPFSAIGKDDVMRRLWLLLVFCTVSSSVFAVSPEAEFVMRFAKGIDENNDCKECISGKYLKAHRLTTTNIKLYGYPGQTSLISDEPPFVVVETVDERDGHAYRIRFKVLKEDGKLVIVPRRPPRLDDGNGIYPHDSQVRVMWNGNPPGN